MDYRITFYFLLNYLIKKDYHQKFYKKVQNGFLRISKNKKRYKIINSNLPIELNKKIIIDKIEKLLK